MNIQLHIKTDASPLDQRLATDAFTRALDFLNREHYVYANCELKDGVSVHTFTKPMSPTQEPQA